MQTPNFFLTKTFWLVFTIIAIISMYLYGMKMIGDKTEIAQTKKALHRTEEELSSCTSDNNSKAKTIEQLNNTISEQSKTISDQTKTLSEKEQSIQEMQNNITELENRPPKIVTKYQTVYKDRPEAYHSYGKGNGNLVIYTSCSDGGSTSVWIDGVFAGYLDKYHSGSVSCYTSGTISKTVLSGSHHITGKDKSNRTWDGYVTVSEDQCQTYRLSCK